MKTKIILFIFIFNYYGLKMCPAVILLKSLKCMAYCPNYFRIGQCELRNNTRGITESFLHLYHVKEPVVQCNMQLTLKKKSKTYNSLIFNNTFDVCSLMAGKNKNRIFSVFHNFLAPYSNLNHSCPYEHDVIVNKFNLNNFANPLPWPAGDYGMELNFLLDKTSHLNVKFTITYIKRKLK